MYRMLIKILSFFTPYILGGTNLPRKTRIIFHYIMTIAHYGRFIC